MFSAEEAKAKTNAANKRKTQEAIAARKQAEQEAYERLEWAKKELLPKYWKELQAQIEKATEDGHSETNYYIPWAKEDELAKIMVDRLLKIGYGASFTCPYHDGGIDSPSGHSTNVYINWGTRQNEPDRPRRW